MFLVTLLVWLFIVGLVTWLAILLRKAGYLPLRRWEVAAFGFGDIQEAASRQVAEAQVAYEITNQEVEELCKSKLLLFRQVEHYVYELVREWEKLDRDPTVPAEWKADIHYIYETCYQGMIAGVPSSFNSAKDDRRGQDGGQGASKEGKGA